MSTGYHVIIRVRFFDAIKLQRNSMLPKYEKIIFFYLDYRVGEQEQCNTVV